MKILFSILFIAMVMGIVAHGSIQDDGRTSAEYARQLSSSDPGIRQSGAEGIARLAAVEQKKLVEGYLLEEKDKRVRLALNWALYRLGKSETLFPIVRDLDSSRHDQATEYLLKLDGPEPLYLFLKQELQSPKLTARIIEVLGQIGNTETLDKIQPFAAHYDPRVAEAAKTATEKIQQRLTQPQPDVKTRPRVVSHGEPQSP